VTRQTLLETAVVEVGGRRKACSRNKERGGVRLLGGERKGEGIVPSMLEEGSSSDVFFRSKKRIKKESKLKAS